MATIEDALKGINAYPIPYRTLIETAVRRGCGLCDEMTAETLKGKPFNLSKADLLMWLSLAPNITQGGISYSFTDEQRTKFRNQAQQIYEEFDEDDLGTAKPIYGYKGNRL